VLKSNYLSAIVRCFSLVTNQRTVLFSETNRASPVNRRKFSVCQKRFLVKFTVPATTARIIRVHTVLWKFDPSSDRSRKRPWSFVIRSWNILNNETPGSVSRSVDRRQQWSCKVCNRGSFVCFCPIRLDLSTQLIRYGTLFFSHNKITSAGLSDVAVNRRLERDEIEDGQVRRLWSG
jgi:hypothetical protein